MLEVAVTNGGSDFMVRTCAVFAGDHQINWLRTNQSTRRNYGSCAETACELLAVIGNLIPFSLRIHPDMGTHLEDKATIGEQSCRNEHALRVIAARNP